MPVTRSAIRCERLGEVPKPRSVPRLSARRWALLLALGALILAELNVACGGAGAVARAASKGGGGCSKAAKAGAAGNAAAGAERAAGVSAAEAAAAGHVDDAVPPRALAGVKDEAVPPKTTGPLPEHPPDPAEPPSGLREHGSDAVETAVDVGSNTVDVASDAEED
ncbi:MAG TPA: hypothetical protein VFU02_21885 [Polyangiaceae bacterium]|nr:hypothetical protein [Polyangiaceae bacterium]